MYQEEDLVAVAKRENNKMRNYLVVNRKQGKHIPVSPKEALQMFHALADLVKQAYGTERLLIIGFAETATAIGAVVAIDLGQYYIQTTREKISDVDYLFFSEVHSHAVEQKVVKDDLDAVIDQIDRIVFVEDEVTTGNTILSAIQVMEETYGRQICCGVASILNGMDRVAEETFRKREIQQHYLVKTDHIRYPQIAECYRGDGTYIVCMKEKVEWYQELLPGGYRNARRLQKAQEYQQACVQMCRQVCMHICMQTCGDRSVPLAVEDELMSCKRILVLGTEEFMYPALILAAELEERGYFVRFHATTRSPIVVSTESEYPFHKRFELVSMYEKERRTFVYDLAAYNEVIIVSDAQDIPKEAECSLYNALIQSGNKHITMVKWKPV